MLLSDLNKSLLHISGLSVSHGSSLVGDSDQGTVGVNIGVAAGHHVPVSVLLLRHVGLLVIVSNLSQDMFKSDTLLLHCCYLVVEVVLRIVIEHLTICTRSDLCDLLSSSIAKSYNLLR